MAEPVAYPREGEDAPAIQLNADVPQLNEVHSSRRTRRCVNTCLCRIPPFSWIIGCLGWNEGGCFLSRWTMYFIFSVIATIGTIHHVYSTREQFYPTVIYLVTSKPCISVLGNMGFVLVVSSALALKRILLGTLYPLELERVNETLRFSVMDTCLALTVFREELSYRVISLFALLLFSKFFHVLADARMDSHEQHDQRIAFSGEGATADSRHSWLGHFRFTSLLSVLFIADCALLSIFAYRVAMEGPSVLVLFGFEFAVMALSVVLIAYRYFLYALAHRIEARTETTWLNKNIYLMYGRLLISLSKLLVLMTYFTILAAFFTFPIMIIRDLFHAFRDVQTELRNLIAARKLRRQLTDRFIRPTQEEIDAAGGVDIISHQTLIIESSIKLPCSHIFREDALLSWWERQQTCPICRYDINQPDPAEYVQERRRRHGRSEVEEASASAAQARHGAAVTTASPTEPVTATSTDRFHTPDHREEVVTEQLLRRRRTTAGDTSESGRDDDARNRALQAINSILASHVPNSSVNMTPTATVNHENTNMTPTHTVNHEKTERESSKHKREARKAKRKRHKHRHHHSHNKYGEPRHSWQPLQPDMMQMYPGAPFGYMPMPNPMYMYPMPPGWPSYPFHTPAPTSVHPTVAGSSHAGFTFNQFPPMYHHPWMQPQSVTTNGTHDAFHNAATVSSALPSMNMPPISFETAAAQASYTPVNMPLTTVTRNMRETSYHTAAVSGAPGACVSTSIVSGISTIASQTDIPCAANAVTTQPSPQVQTDLGADSVSASPQTLFHTLLSKTMLQPSTASGHTVSSTSTERGSELAPEFGRSEQIEELRRRRLAAFTPKQHKSDDTSSNDAA